MLRFATQSLQSFPLDTFPLPRTSNSAGFGQHTRRSRRGKSGSAGFGQHTRRSRRGKSGGAGFGQHTRRSRRGKSDGAGFGQHTRKSKQSRRPPFPKMANICRTHRNKFKKSKPKGFDFLNSFLPFFAGTSPRTPSLTCDAARAGVSASL